MAISFTTLKSRTALNLGNLQAAHPRYGELGDWVNEATNRIVLMAVARDRRAVNIFPELRHLPFSDLTVNAQDYLNVPAEILVLDSLSITKSTAAYASGTQTEYSIIEETDPQLFGLLQKSTTGYPSKWIRSGITVKLWPTPTTAFLTRIVFRGVRRAAELSGSGLAACTATIAAGAGVTAGTHSYKISFTTSAGETTVGPVSNIVTTSGGNLQVNLTAIPVGDANVTARKVYRTAANLAIVGPWLLQSTIADNSTTTLSDNTADAALTTTAPTTGVDVATMDALWHPAIIDYASYLGANALGWVDDAQKWLVAAEQKVTQTINLVGLERQGNRSRVIIRGAPRANY